MDFKWKLKISLRYKLLLLLCLVATTVLSIFLIFSSTLFEKDKSVYIFDSSATYSRSISTQIRSAVTFTIEKINIIMGGVKDNGRTFDEASQKLFKEDARIKTLLLVSEKMGEGTFTRINTLVKEKEDAGGITITPEQEAGLISSIKVNKLAFYTHEKENIYLLAYAFSSEGDETVYVLVAFESLDLKMAFEASQSFASYLIDQSGEVIMRSENITLDRINRFINSNYFDKLAKNKVPEGTADVKTQDGNLLVSYNRIGMGDLMVISEIDKRDAFKTLDILLIKSGLFFIALISLSVIFAVIFSNSLTSALRRLNEAVQQVAEGKFDINVNIRSSDEVGQLADGFNIMTEKISRLLTELKQYSEGLEVMVNDRTKELSAANNFIKTMIDSLGQGLVVFDQAGKCLPVYTKASTEIFKTEPKDKYVWDILRVAQEKIVGLKKWVDSMFKEMIPFKDMARLGPQSLTDDGRFVQIEYRPMRAESTGNTENAETTAEVSSPLSGVVVVATDKTQEHLAKIEAQKNLDHVNMITKLIRNKDQFLSFIRDAKQILEKLTSLVEEGERENGEFDLKNTKLMLHSLKGSAGVYSLSELQRTVHEYESDLDRFQKASPVEVRGHLPTLKTQINKLKEIFESYSEQFKVFLGESIIDGKYRIEVRHDQLLNFAAKLKPVAAHHPIYKEFIEDFVKVPIVNFFKGYSDLVIEVSKRKGKEMNPLVFQGGDVRIVKEYYSKLFTSFVHVFTNAVDHGLEVPEDREASGKTRAGTVLVSFYKQSIQDRPMLKIVVQDDGRGIDPARIRAKLAANGVSAEKIESDDYEVIQHIFDDNFSTAETVSLTSGRGVGLGALKEAAESLGGAINVTSAIGKGTRFTVLVPYL